MEKWQLGAMLVSLACAACSDNSDSSESGDNTPIASTVLSGTIGGKPWTLQAAETDSFLSDESAIWVDAYGEAVATPCSGFVTTSAYSMILNVPPMPGDYPLSLALNATFVVDDMDPANLVATRGHMVVDSVTDTQVSGGAFIEFDSNNSVNGQFTATVCP